MTLIHQWAGARQTSPAPAQEVSAPMQSDPIREDLRLVKP